MFERLDALTTMRAHAAGDPRPLHRTLEKTMTRQLAMELLAPVRLGRAAS